MDVRPVQLFYLSDTSGLKKGQARRDRRLLRERLKDWKMFVMENHGKCIRFTITLSLKFPCEGNANPYTEL
jgi:hypothetical protein